MFQPQQHVDTTKKIWEWLFRVRVPYLASRNIDVLRLTGVVITGIPEIDRDRHNEMITTYLCIDQMVELYRNGVPVIVPDREDVKKIYQHISDHIYAWKEFLTMGVNIGQAPIDDLILMDQFASTVHNEVKYMPMTEDLDDLVTRRFTEVSKFNANNILNFRNLPSKANVKVMEGITKINSEDKYPERNGLGEFFKNVGFNLGRYNV